MLNNPVSFDATKEIFLPTAGAYGGCGMLGDFGVSPLLDDPTRYASCDFFVPWDFRALAEAALVIIPTTTDAVNDIDIYSDYGRIGEAYNTHTGTDEASTYNTVANQLFEIDITALLASLDAGDYVGIRTRAFRVADPVYLVGVRFKYS